MSSGTAIPMRLGRALPEATFERIARALGVSGCKWDLQLQDSPTLARFPLLLSRAAWAQLSHSAEELTAETLAVEQALLKQPRLWPALNLSPRLKLPAPSGDPAQGRVFRFDFHYTAEGWRVSEVNSDVPGGYVESTEFPRLFANECPGTEPCGAPGEAWARSIAAAAPGGTIGILSAPGYLEDQQVAAYLARRLDACLIQPRQVSWRAGRPFWQGKALDGIVRFYQGEWLLRDTVGRSFMEQTAVPMLNSARALLSESKRLPLLWPQLGVELTTWRRLLPECAEPAQVPWESDPSWLLKKAWSNTGDAVHCHGWPGSTSWRSSVRRKPHEWVAQRRFEPVTLDGLRPCIGVYTINGKTAGAYGRISRGEIIDRHAQDVAILLENDSAS